MTSSLSLYMLIYFFSKQWKHFLDIRAPCQSGHVFVYLEDAAAADQAPGFSEGTRRKDVDLTISHAISHSSGSPMYNPPSPASSCDTDVQSVSSLAAFLPAIEKGGHCSLLSSSYQGWNQIALTCVVQFH